MTQIHKINAQTAAMSSRDKPGFVSSSPQYYDDKVTGFSIICSGSNHSRSSVVLAEVKPMCGETAPYTESAQNARVMAKGFAMLDKAGRTLGVDAAELGESIDLAALIRAAACNEHKEVDEWLAENVTRAQLAKLPKPAQP